MVDLPSEISDNRTLLAQIPKSGASAAAKSMPRPVLSWVAHSPQRVHQRQSFLEEMQILMTKDCVR